MKTSNNKWTYVKTSEQSIDPIRVPLISCIKKKLRILYGLAIGGCVIAAAVTTKDFVFWYTCIHAVSARTATVRVSWPIDRFHPEQDEVKIPVFSTCVMCNSDVKRATTENIDINDQQLASIIRERKKLKEHVKIVEQLNEARKETPMLKDKEPSSIR